MGIIFSNTSWTDFGQIEESNGNFAERRVGCRQGLYFRALFLENVI